MERLEMKSKPWKTLDEVILQAKTWTIYQWPFICVRLLVCCLYEFLAALVDGLNSLELVAHHGPSCRTTRYYEAFENFDFVQCNRQVKDCRRLRRWSSQSAVS
jgi:hypothetical protein